MRRRTLLLATGVTVASPFVYAEATDLPPHVMRLLSMKEEEIDVAEAALILAKDIYPDLNIANYMGKIKRLASRVALWSLGPSDPEHCIRAMNTVLFIEERYRYDKEPFALSKEAYRFLNGILDTGMGICVTLPMLYVAVAQRVGYPIYPVHVPDHNFARYRHPTFAMANIECTSGGKFFTDENYIRRFAVSKRGLASGAYMRTMTYREYLGDLLSMTAGAFGRRRQFQKCVNYMFHSIEANPRSALDHMNLGEAYMLLGKAPGGTAQLIANGEHYINKAKELGFVSREEVFESREIRGK